MFEYEIEFLRMDWTNMVASYNLLPTDPTLNPRRLNLVISQDTIDEIMPMTLDEMLVYMRPKVIEADSGAQEAWEKQKAIMGSEVKQMLASIEGRKFFAVTLDERESVHSKPVSEVQEVQI